MYILKRSCCKLSKKFIYIWNQFDCVTTLYYCWSLVTTQPQIWSDLRANTGSLPLELPACIDVCSVTRLRTKPGYHGRCISHLSDSCLSAYPALWLQLAKLAQIKKKTLGWTIFEDLIEAAVPVWLLSSDKLWPGVNDEGLKCWIRPFLVCLFSHLHLSFF